MAAQNANAVAITGGTVAGITDLPIADGGTGTGTKLTAFNALSPAIVEGDIIFRDAANNIKLAIGVADQVLTVNAGATAPEWVTPLTVATDEIWDVAGDIVHANGANSAIRLPIGAIGNVLTVNGAGTAPEWSVPGAGTDVANDLIWNVAGDLVYADGANHAVILPIGTANQILAVNAGATAPEWVTPPTGIAGDPIWDVEGDLVIGTGVDSGTRLPRGTTGQYLKMNALGTRPEWGIVTAVGSVGTDIIWDAAGDLVYGTGPDAAVRLPKGAAAQLLAMNSADTAPEWISELGQNFLINGDFKIAQRGTTFTAATVPLNSDDTYLLDRWTLLSDGNDIVDVSQETTAANLPTGAAAAIKFDIETEDKKFGVIQIIEAKNSCALIGGTVSLSFKAARGAGDNNTLIRAAVLSWNSVADVVTSDVVNVWGNEGTNPTLVANWTFENVPVALAALTDAWQTYKIEGIAIDTASTTNIAVFIWSEDKTNDVGDLVYITNIKLELNPTATVFVPRLMGHELELCKRYYEIFAPVINFGYYAMGYASITTSSRFVLRYIEKRIIPTITISDVTKFLVQYLGTSTATTDLFGGLISVFSCQLVATVAAVLTAGDGVVLMGENVAATHWIGVSAEL